MIYRPPACWFVVREKGSGLVGLRLIPSDNRANRFRFFSFAKFANVKSYAKAQL